MDQQTDNEYVKDIIKKSLGVSPENIPPEFQQIAWNVPRWHLLMLQDKPRMEYYSSIIRPKVKDKIVLDVGTGSGILSYLALKWGAKKVYSVEENPALQAVYRHLMRDHLESGRAELISDDAQFLRLGNFSDGPPDVIVHELFGAYGMGENLIPIFRALSSEGILTDKTEIVPDLLEAWMRPVVSDQLSQDDQIEAFEGYPLNELNVFGHQNFWEQDYSASLASNWQTVGQSQLLFRCYLRDLILPEKVTIAFEASSASHIKLWMNIIDKNTGLVHANDHQALPSHWSNSYLSIPPWLRGSGFNVEFKIHPDRIEVHRFSKN